MKPKVVYVDDEIKNLKALKRLFQSESFEFITYDSPIRALSKIEKIKPAVVISDQCMPEMKGTDFLEIVKNKLPTSVGIILTGYADLETAIESINKGHVYSFIQKPWNDEDLRKQVQSAIKNQESIYWLRGLTDILIDEIIEKQKDHKTIQKLSEALCNELSQSLMIITGYLQLINDHIGQDEMTNLYIANILSKIHDLEQLGKKIRSVSKRIISSNLVAP